MAKSERLYSVEEAAFATRLTIASFRVKVSKLGIKGVNKPDNARKVYYTRSQLQDIYDNKAAKTTKLIKALAVKNAKAKKATAQRTERKQKAKK
jgi:hypothetical protein